MISKRIKKYVKTAAAILSSSSLANASVVYTDVVPDVALNPNDTFNIDINNDAIVDFDLSFSTSSGGGGFTSRLIKMEGLLSGNSMLVNGSNYVDALSNSVSISTALTNWNGNRRIGFYSQYSSYFSSTTSTFTFSRGGWSGLSNRYVGVKFDISGNIHYGWVRLSVGSSYNSVTIHDYAYESISGNTILTGDGIPSVNTIDISGCDSVHIFGNTFTSSQTAYDTIVGGAASGADSINIANIVINNSEIINIDTSIVQGSSIIIDGNTVTTAGTYSETLQNTDGCDSTIHYTVSVIQGIDKRIIEEINIYPNPAKDKITIDASAISSDISQIKIVDLQGKELVVKRNVNNENNELDISGLDRGFYFLLIELFTGEYQITRITKM